MIKHSNSTLRTNLERLYSTKFWRFVYILTVILIYIFLTYEVDPHQVSEYNSFSLISNHKL